MMFGDATDRERRVGEGGWVDADMYRKICI